MGDPIKYILYIAQDFQPSRTPFYLSVRLWV